MKRGMFLFFLVLLLAPIYGCKKAEVSSTTPEPDHIQREKGTEQVQAGKLTLTVSDVSVRSGSPQITVPILLDDKGRTVRAVQLVLSYNPEILTLVGVEKTDRTKDMSVFSHNVPVPGHLRMAIMDFGGGVIPSGKESIAKFLFDISPKVSPGTKTPLKLVINGERDTALFDPKGESYELEVRDGTLIIS